jgi:hypothetical protein
VEVIPIIKESNHWLYSAIGESFKEGEIIDIELKGNEGRNSMLPVRVESSVSSGKSRRGRKPGQKDVKPRVRRTKREMEQERKQKMSLFDWEEKEGKVSV